MMDYSQDDLKALAAKRLKEIDEATNDPKILVEFTPEEIKALSDHFHDVYWQITSIKPSVENPDTLAKLEAKQKLVSKIMNRLLDKADDQGFGNL